MMTTLELIHKITYNCIIYPDSTEYQLTYSILQRLLFYFNVFKRKINTLTRAFVVNSKTCVCNHEISYVCSEIITKMVLDIGPYGLITGCYGDAHHKPDLLWACVTSQIYNGEIHLKKVW